MARNVEIKARVDNMAALEQKVRAIATRGPELLTQTDTFFHVPHGRLKLREFADGSAELIAYSRSDQSGPKLSSYERVAVHDAAGLARTLARSNGIAQKVRKNRTLYLVGQTRVHLDRVENLGEFMELEVVLAEAESLEHGERIAQELMQTLGIAPGQLVTNAYADLLATKRKETATTP
ncbi:MAG: class IV adenylate cyclase [Burkholderiaceae bacterium]